MGRFWLLLESFSDVLQHSTASQGELGCGHFKHKCKFWHFIVLQEIQPHCFADSEGPELHGTACVSAHGPG